MTDHELEAVRLFGVSTDRKFRIWTLAGNARIQHRAHIMSYLLGLGWPKKCPQAKAGINVLRAKLYALAGIDETTECEVVLDDQLVTWCREVEAANGWAADRCYGRKL